MSCCKLSLYSFGRNAYWIFLEKLDLASFPLTFNGLDHIFSALGLHLVVVQLSSISLYCQIVRVLSLPS
jgi:hypothetical protein